MGTKVVLEGSSDEVEELIEIEPTVEVLLLSLLLLLLLLLLVGNGEVEVDVDSGLSCPVSVANVINLVRRQGRNGSDAGTPVHGRRRG